MEYVSLVISNHVMEVKLFCYAISAIASIATIFARLRSWLNPSRPEAMPSPALAPAATEEKRRAYQQLNALVAECNRAQMTIAQQKAHGRCDYRPAAKHLKKCRNEMKNFALGSSCSMYVDLETKAMVKDLDHDLGNTAVWDVREKVRALSTRIADEIRRIDEGR